MNDSSSETQGKSMKEVLALCQEAASIGYGTAKKESKNLENVFIQAQNEIEKTVDKLHSSEYYIPAVTDKLDKQLYNIESSFNELETYLDEELSILKENLSNFTITLFGRTTTGKSTLMETLIHGNGSSIGKGAQRTTRDVRTYQWNGLIIKDLPGFGAFEGKDDDQIAVNGAKSGDLIIFLLSDDAIQKVEADFLSQIINLGKPVICVVNVKKAITIDDIEYGIEEICDEFNDKERFSQLRKQFFEYGRSYGQDWHNIPFVFVHLKAAFLSTSKMIPDEAIRSELYKISHIGRLKWLIREQVAKNGQLYRIKTYVDSVVNPMLDSMDLLLEQASSNTIQAETISAKQRKLRNWKYRFIRDSKDEIHSEIIRIQSELNEEIAEFAEEHYNDKNADKAWNEVLKSKRINDRCQETLNGLADKANDNLSEFSTEIKKELQYVSISLNDRSLKVHNIVNTRKIWNWSTNIIGGALSIATLLLFLAGSTVSGQFGIATTGVGIAKAIGNKFFKSREAKIREARIYLQNKLLTNIQGNCEHIEDQMNKTFDKQIVPGLDEANKQLLSIIYSLRNLASVQTNSSWKINESVRSLNSWLVCEALRLTGNDDAIKYIDKVARVPGNQILVMLQDGETFPAKARSEIEGITFERLYFVFDSNDKKILLSRILGKTVDRNNISINNRSKIAHIGIENASNDLKIRVNEAQQLTELLIIK